MHQRRRELDAAKSSNDQLIHEITHLKTELKAKQSEVEDLDKSLWKARDEAAAQKAEDTRKINDLQDTINKNKGHDAEDHSIIEETRKKLQQAIELQDELRGKLTSAELNVQDTMNRLQTALAEIVGLKAEIKELEIQLHAQVKTISHLDKENTDLSRRNGELESELRTARSQLQFSKEERFAEVTELKKQIAELERKKNGYKNDLIKKQAELNAYKTTAQQELANAKAKAKADFDKHVKQDSLDRAAHDAADKSFHDKHDKEDQKQQREFTQVKKELTDLRNEYNEYKARVLREKEAHKAQDKKYHDEHEAADKRYHDKHNAEDAKDKAKAAQELADLRKKHEEYKKRAEKAEKELADLKKEYGDHVAKDKVDHEEHDAVDKAKEAKAAKDLADVNREFDDHLEDDYQKKKAQIKKDEEEAEAGRRRPRK